MKVGLLVPDVRMPGGIQKHALFVLSVLETLPGVEVEVLSMAMSSLDQASVRLLSPSSWRTGITSEPARLADKACKHVGAVFPEFETQRFRPRPLITAFLKRQDLVAVVAGAPSWALPAVGLGVPVVLTVATMTSWERSFSRQYRPSLRHTIRRLMTPLVDRLDERALERVDAVIVENRRMYGHAVARRREAKRILLAPPGVDIEAFHPATKRCQSDTPYFIFVGRPDDPRKNIGMLLDAYQLLLSRLPNPPGLKIVGTTAPRDGVLPNIPNGLIEVIINPSDQRLAELYAGALASVLTSTEEGFGFVVVEAMACGIPAIATRCGGPEDIITEGCDGYLVDCGDVLALADRLQRLATNRCLNLDMGNAARRKVVREFSLDATEAKHRQLYLDILDRLEFAGQAIR